MIAVVDMNLGNVHSVCNALNYLKIKNVLTNNIAEIRKADKLIFPGVGSFSEASKRLFQSGIRECIRNEVIDNNKPILGICLGMQLLAARGEEGGISEGLGLIDAVVSRIRCDAAKYRLPHIGWNDISNHGMPLLKNTPDNTCFYFVHSYEMILNETCEYATTSYGVEFIAAVQKKHIMGTQFHPEKSREKGMNILKLFAETVF